MSSLWRPTLRKPRFQHRPPSPWCQFATSTPMADVDFATRQCRSVGLGHLMPPKPRTVKGYWSSYDAVPLIAWMNRATFNLLRQSCNPKDFYGRRICGLGASLINGRNLHCMNLLFTGDDLPEIVIDGFVPDGKVVVSESGERGCLIVVG
jgi:hypothetical protein